MSTDPLRFHLPHREDVDVATLVRVVRLRDGTLSYDDPDTLFLNLPLTARCSVEFTAGGCRADVVPLVSRFGLIPPGERVRVRIAGECLVLKLVLPRSLLAGGSRRTSTRMRSAPAFRGATRSTIPRSGSS